MQNNGVYIRLLVTGLIMFNFAICYIIYTMYTGIGLSFSSGIIVIYVVYILVMLGCFAAAFTVGKKR